MKTLTGTGTKKGGAYKDIYNPWEIDAEILLRIYLFDIFTLLDIRNNGVITVGYNAMVRVFKNLLEHFISVRAETNRGLWYSKITITEVE